MFGEPAGWYRDPAPPNPYEPTTLRFWDGESWTTRVKPASRQQRGAWRLEQQLVHAATPGPAAPGLPVGMVLETSSREVTPDGQRLSGWWRRFLAVWADSLVLGLLSVIVGWHFVSELADIFRQTILAAQQSAAAGTPYVADQEALGKAVLHPIVALLAVRWALALVYDVSFLTGFGATPGKMLWRIEVRLVSRPGPPPLGTVLARWFTQQAGSLLGLLPVLSLVTWAYTLLDCLWPVWDGRRQALHDKVARTVVVRR